MLEMHDDNTAMLLHINYAQIYSSIIHQGLFVKHIHVTDQIYSKSLVNQKKKEPEDDSTSHRFKHLV